MLQMVRSVAAEQPLPVKRAMKIVTFLYSRRAVLFFAFTALFWSFSPSQAQNQAPTYDKPLGIAMEEWPYPFPVRYFDVNYESQILRMAYMDVAPDNPNGQVVLLLHGKNFYGSYWENTIKFLNAAGYRVVVPDQIGFGKSAKPDIPYSFDWLAANTVHLLDSLGITKVAVVGHSMGGMLAVRFARNYPKRASHLILENPIGLEDYRFKVPPQTLEQQLESELKNTDAAKIRDFLKRYFVTWKPDYESFVEARTRVTLSGEYSRWAKSSAETYQMIYQQPVRHEFSLIAVPTLLIIGQADRTTLGRGQVSEVILKTLGNYPQLGREAARDIPNSKLIEIANVGHIPHLEDPTKFHDSLLNFLKG